MMEDRAAIETDVVTHLSRQSVAGTVAKLTGMISAKGMRLFAVIDQAAEARQAGLALRETTLVIFGSPEAGTPVMVASPPGGARPAAQGADPGRRRPDQSLLLCTGGTGYPPPPHRRSGRQLGRRQRPHRRASGFLAPIPGAMNART
jgi:hypothetical protein